MQKLKEAVGTLKLDMEAQPIVREATEDIIRWALRMERALLFYADESRYIDGVIYHKDRTDGLAGTPDNGAWARYALGDDNALSQAVIREGDKHE